MHVGKNVWGVASSSAIRVFTNICPLCHFPKLIVTPPIQRFSPSHVALENIHWKSNTRVLSVTRWRFLKFRISPKARTLLPIQNGKSVNNTKASTKISKKTGDVIRLVLDFCNSSDGQYNYLSTLNRVDVVSVGISNLSWFKYNSFYVRIKLLRLNTTWKIYRLSNNSFNIYIFNKIYIKYLHIYMYVCICVCVCVCVTHTLKYYTFILLKF